MDGQTRRITVNERSLKPRLKPFLCLYMATVRVMNVDTVNDLFDEERDPRCSLHFYMEAMNLDGPVNPWVQRRGYSAQCVGS